jgi:hypothetical protein
MAKLNYKIVGRKKAEGAGAAAMPHDIASIEWRHADGPITTVKTIPITHPPEIEYKDVPDQVLDVIHDEVSVPQGAPDSIVMQICEEKRAKLAQTLGVDP